MTVQIALLRGINVGGNNKIKMADLRQALTEDGFINVQTYIQSGNILFESADGEAVVRERLERLIEARFGLAIRVIVRTLDELRAIVAGLPFTEREIELAKETAGGEVLYVSMMLDEPKPERATKLRGFDAQNDRYVIAERDVYLLYGTSVRDSKLSAQVDKLNPPATVRNWNTINKLIAMAEAIERG